MVKKTVVLENQGKQRLEIYQDAESQHYHIVITERTSSTFVCTEDDLSKIIEVLIYAYAEGE